MQEMGMSTELVSSNDKAGEPQNETSKFTEKAGEKETVSVIDDLACSRKRQKLDESRAVQPVTIEATEDSILNWLKNFDNGVSLAYQRKNN